MPIKSIRGLYQARPCFDAAAAGGAWTPASLPGLVVWLDASNSGSITQSSGAVSQWNDLSGNGNNFVQATGANKPTFSATGFNGSKPGITVVAASAQFVQNTSVPFNSSTLSIFVVNTLTASSEDNSGLVSFLGSGQANDFNNAASFILFTSNVHSLYRLTSSTYDDFANAATVATPATIGWVFDGTNGTGYLNFAADTPAAKTGTLGATTANIAFGSRPWNSNTPSFDGTYGEIVLTNTAMSSGDRASLHTYLTSKWGVP